MPEIPRWHNGGMAPGGRDAVNIAACAIVATKVYEAMGWQRWDPNTHVYGTPDVEEIAALLTDLGRQARAAKESDHLGQIGKLRFLAWCDDDGPDSSVDFWITLGSDWTSDTAMAMAAADA